MPDCSAARENHYGTESLPTDGDVFKIQGPFKIPWTEAIMGCPVKLLPESGASWAERFLDDLSDLDYLRLKPDPCACNVREEVYKIILDGGYTHFMEIRMDASFSVTPLSMMQAIRLQKRGLVDTEQIISHSFPLEQIDEAMRVMDQPQRNKVIIVQE